MISAARHLNVWAASTGARLEARWVILWDRRALQPMHRPLAYHEAGPPDRGRASTTGAEPSRVAPLDRKEQLGAGVLEGANGW